MICRPAALAPIVALAVAGTLLPAHADGEEATSPRVITIDGRPLSEVAGGTFGIRGTRRPTPTVEGWHLPIARATIAPQTTSVASEGMSRTNRIKKLLLGAAITGAAGAVAGWALGGITSSEGRVRVALTSGLIAASVGAAMRACGADPGSCQ